MKNTITLSIQIILSLVLLISLISMGGCTTNGSAHSTGTAPSLPPTAGTPTAPMILELSFPNGAPPLNQTAELRCILKVGSGIADDVNIKINLPDGIELVSSDGSWPLGHLNQQEIRELKVIIRPRKVGNYTIGFVRSWVSLDSSIKGGAGEYKIYLSVSETSAQWSAVYPPWLPIEVTPKPTSVTPVPPKK